MVAVGRDIKVEEKHNQSVIPTAQTRSALEKLIRSSPEKLLSEEVNLRELLQDLFNWSGVNKVNKALIREFNAAVNTEGRYAHTVELTGFLVAIAPLLEPDRIARLYAASRDVQNVYAPAKYTLQLSTLLKKIFKGLSQERIERLAYSLWVSTHNGNWWHLTLGPQKDEILDLINDPPLSTEQAVQLLEDESLPWSLDAAEALKTSERSSKLADLIKEHNRIANLGEATSVDLPLLSSYMNWLEIYERPESPILGLLMVLQPIMEDEQYIAPKKAREFVEMFPPIDSQRIISFPLPRVFAEISRMNLPKNADTYLILDAQQLASNAQYMGNCTMSFRPQMERGDYALYKIDYGNTSYNAGLCRRNNRWVLGEVNSRHNRYNVPQELKNALFSYVERLNRSDLSLQLEQHIMTDYKKGIVKLI